MTKFDLRKVEEIKALELVEELVIDGIGALELLRNQLIGTTFEVELDPLIAFIQHFSNGGNPGNKLKYLKNKTLGITELEFRSKHLRVFAIQQPGKKILIYGGVKKKADSSDLIARFRLIKDEFVSTLNAAKK